MILNIINHQSSSTMRLIRTSQSATCQTPLDFYEFLRRSHRDCVASQSYKPGIWSLQVTHPGRWTWKSLSLAQVPVWLKGWTRNIYEPTDQIWSRHERGKQPKRWECRLTKPRKKDDGNQDMTGENEAELGSKGSCSGRQQEKARSLLKYIPKTIIVRYDSQH